MDTGWIYKYYGGGFARADLARIEDLGVTGNLLPFRRFEFASNPQAAG